MPGYHVARAPGAPEQLPDDLVTPMAGHPRQERMSVPIGEVSGVLQLPEGRKGVPAGVRQGAPHPHRRLGRRGTDGQVLGHALDEPERQMTGPRQSAEAVGAAIPGDVVLERVDQLVADDVVQIAERAAGGQHDTAAESLGDTAGALADPAAYRVGLLELRRAGVEDQRLAAVQLVIEDAGQPGIPPLRHASGVCRCLFLGGIEMDVEVLGLEHPEIEAFVLDFVPAEVLGLDRRRQRREEEREKPERTAVAAAVG